MTACEAAWWIILLMVVVVLFAFVYVAHVLPMADDKKCECKVEEVGDDNK